MMRSYEFAGLTPAHLVIARAIGTPDHFDVSIREKRCTVRMRALSGSGEIASAVAQT
jgi:hypothetical protein